jgi:hypothetical protein
MNATAAPDARQMPCDAPPGRRIKRLGAGLAAVGAGSAGAYAAGHTDARTCNPDSPFQWHGVWHLLSGAAFVLGADILYRPNGGLA